MKYTLEEMKKNKEKWQASVEDYEKQRETNGNENIWNSLIIRILTCFKD